MLRRNSITTIALATALTMGTLASVPARADDAAKYPDWKGQWVGIGADAPDAPWDPGKPGGAAQQAPLTPEYQGIYQAILARHASGVKEPTTCLPPGMPRTMLMYEPMEIIVMPDTTYLMITYMSEFRRVFTDGRKWPEDIEPSYAGYSIGHWVDENKDGHYNVLEVETRALKGPRAFDASGLPLHKDNETVVKERIFLDKNDLNLLHDEVTTFDHALTHPWTVTRNYHRERNAVWNEFVCAEDNHQVMLGKENYVISDQGYLSPTRPGQPPPDLKYFNQPKK
jgi:hypothetical protein